jgi:regulator of replication initiation timing
MSWLTYLFKKVESNKKYIASLETRNQELIDTLLVVMEENDSLREQLDKLSAKVKEPCSI